MVSYERKNVVILFCMLFLLILSFETPSMANMIDNSDESMNWQGSMVLKIGAILYVCSNGPNHYSKIQIAIDDAAGCRLNPVIAYPIVGLSPTRYDDMITFWCIGWWSIPEYRFHGYIGERCIVGVYFQGGPVLF